MWTSWDRVSLRAHAGFVIAMLAVGAGTSLLLHGLQQVLAAWTVVFIVSSGAAGALVRLRMRLPDADAPQP